MKESTASILAIVRANWWELTGTQGEVKNRLRNLFKFSKEVREAIQNRCGGICEHCGFRPAEHLDHRLPIGFFRFAAGVKVKMRGINNAQFLCIICHKAKEVREEGLAAALKVMLGAKIAKPVLVQVVAKFLQDERRIAGKVWKANSDKHNRAAKNLQAFQQAWQTFRKALAAHGKHERNWRKSTPDLRAKLEKVYQGIQIARRGG